jgi:hypothetical protein
MKVKSRTLSDALGLLLLILNSPQDSHSHPKRFYTYFSLSWFPFYILHSWFKDTMSLRSENYFRVVRTDPHTLCIVHFPHTCIIQPDLVNSQNFLFSLALQAVQVQGLSQAEKVATICKETRQGLPHSFRQEKGYSQTPTWSMCL